MSSNPETNRKTPAEQALLAGLEDVPWHALRHAYGPATNVPDILRALVSDDAAARQAAWDEFFSSVWHQGTVYEATAYVVPFLLRMLSGGGQPGPADLLACLGLLAEGSSYLAVHGPYSDDPEVFERMLRQEGRGDVASETLIELGWVEAANRAVGEGLPLYLALLDNAERQVREAALGVLARLRGRAAMLVPALRQQLQAAGEPWLKRGLARAIYEVMEAGPEATGFFTDLLDQSDDPTVVLTAAAALAARLREQTPERVVSVLLRAAERRRSAAWHTDEIGAEQPGTQLEFTPQGLALAIEALTWLGPDRAIPALLSALPGLTDPEAVREAAGRLLDVAFNAGQVQTKSVALGVLMRDGPPVQRVQFWAPRPQPERAPATLDSAQRQVLVMLSEHDAFWHDEHDLLKLYGLPPAREALRRYLAAR